MNNAIFNFVAPTNEPVYPYFKNSPERILLEQELMKQSGQIVDIPLIINGKEIRTGITEDVVMPCDHGHVLARYHKATAKETQMAVDAALGAKKRWLELSWIERSMVMLKAAELISKKYRYVLSAATMLGQAKNCYQSEIDAICETADFLRFNTYFVAQIYNQQPVHDFNHINRLEYRPLEGFIYTISPFNFTAIAANLNASVAVMGNTTVWKPASTSMLSSYYLMKIFMEAGLPDGVINMVPGAGPEISEIVLNHKELSGIHFTGSNNTFDYLWTETTKNLKTYKSYPKLIGETGGKDFIFAHPSADPLELSTSLIAGAFEYQGQKCSACSRAYIPNSLWDSVRMHLKEMHGKIRVGDVRDFNNFVNAVIDEKSFDNIMNYIHYVQESKDAEIILGGKGDKSKGYFVEPTVVLTTNPYFRTMQEEIFGPVLTIFLYEDDKFQETLELCDATSPYGLTGSIFSKDRYALIEACKTLRYSAGNFYYNDKCTGAMVGRQPFGGARASGTNDKAGSMLNLLRWVSPRTIKETLISPTDFRYGYME
jgi:1-pyrroline-5-carboxylate dehydrogenase